MSELSQPQQAVLNAIVRLTRRNGISPSVREIGDLAGLRSTSTVHTHLRNLQRLGMVEWRPETPRSIRVVGGPDQHDQVRALCAAARTYAEEARLRFEVAEVAGPDAAYWALREATTAVEASLPPLR